MKSVCVCVCDLTNQYGSLCVWPDLSSRVCALGLSKCPLAAKYYLICVLRAGLIFLSSTFAPSVTASCLLKPISAFTVIFLSLSKHKHTLYLSLSAFILDWSDTGCLLLIKCLFFDRLHGLRVGHCTCRFTKKS